MAETTIMNTAGTFSIPVRSQPQWICRDDNDDYWTVVRDTTGNLRVYKSINDGVTWLLKKTITNSDFSGGNPLPTHHFQLINCSGQDKIYLRIVGQTAQYLNFSWIFNVTADTNNKGMDGVKFTVSYGDQDLYGCIAWDFAGNRLLVMGYQGSPGSTSKFGIINLTTHTIDDQTSGVANENTHHDYYISPTDGYGYIVHGYSASIYLEKYNNGVNYGSRLEITNDSWAADEWLFAGVVTDSNGDPIIYGLYRQSSNYYISIQRHDKDSLSTHTVVDSYNLGTTAPEMCSMTIDGNDNIYFLVTKGTDKEAYSIKYEIRVPAASSQMLVTYQATA